MIILFLLQVKQIPNLFMIHNECFDNLDVATSLAIRGTLRRIFGDNLNDHDPLALRGVKTMFADKPELDLEFDYKKRVVIFWFTTPKGKNAEKQMSQIRDHISMEYGKSFSNFNTRLGITAFRSLKKEARDEVISRCREMKNNSKFHDFLRFK